MAYYFMLGVVPLPITPSALTIKTPSMNKTVTLVNDGEINIPKDQGLREISFEFLLPTVQKYPFATWQLGGYTATLLIPLLNTWKRTKLYFPFIVVRLSPGGDFMYFTSIKCLIEDFEYKEDAEEYGLDTMCSIKLKEYKPYATKRVKLKQGANGSRNTLLETVNNRDSSSKTSESSILTAIKGTFGAILPFAMRDTGTLEIETIISASKRNGDNFLSVLDLNDIKIPELVENPDFEDCSLLKELNISNSFDYEPSNDGSNNEISSLSDILLFGSMGRKYKAPSALSKKIISPLDVII